jgi:hypothetical protein
MAHIRGNHYLPSFYSVQVRKLGADTFQLAPGIAEAPARQAPYVKNTPMLVPIAEGRGIGCVRPADRKSARTKPASFGLRNGEKATHETI